MKSLIFVLFLSIALREASCDDNLQAVLSKLESIGEKLNLLESQYHEHKVPENLAKLHDGIVKLEKYSNETDTEVMAFLDKIIEMHPCQAAGEVKIVDSDISQEFQDDAIAFAKEAIEKHPFDAKKRTKYIQDSMNKKTSKSWHCMTGEDFIYSVIYEKHYFSYFFVGRVGVLIFSPASLE